MSRAEIKHKIVTVCNTGVTSQLSGNPSPVFVRIEVMGQMTDMDTDMEGEGVIKNVKVKMLNIFLLGCCFCFVFTGFNTMGQTQVDMRDI